MSYRRVELEDLSLSPMGEGSLLATFPDRVELYTLAIHPDDVDALHVDRIRFGGAELVGGPASSYLDDTIRRSPSLSFQVGGVQLPAAGLLIKLTLEAGGELRIDLRNLAYAERKVRSAFYVRADKAAAS